MNVTKGWKFISEVERMTFLHILRIILRSIWGCNIKYALGIYLLKILSVDLKFLRRCLFRTRRQAELSLLLTSACFFFALHLDHEGGGGMFFRNFGISPNYMAVLIKI
jgi:hypothetical protein